MTGSHSTLSNGELKQNCYAVNQDNEKNENTVVNRINTCSSKPLIEDVKQSTAPDKQHIVGIDGIWYDVEKFYQHHPGGSIIKKFFGKDATSVFYAFHKSDEVLKHRQRVGKYVRNFDDPATKAFEKLRRFFEENGLFVTNYRWYAMKFAIAVLLLAVVFTIVMSGVGGAWGCCLAGLVLAAFWQQCGFLMHDTMHTQVTRMRKYDHFLGTVTGTVCVGMSGTWWRDEHFLHHSLTNVVDYAEEFADPQMWETVWAQNEKLFPYFQTLFQLITIRVQHITFLPICVFFGRIAIVIDGFTTERHWYEWLAGALHWSWVLLLLSLTTSWREAAILYATAAVGEGVLHIQLLISHYAKPFQVKSDMHEMEFCRFQAEANINIANPVWLDWFHGGLNLHLEHHLFPRLPRHNLRRAQPYVRRTCEQVGIEYDECTWFEAVQRTLAQLRKMSHHFKLDPR